MAGFFPGPNGDETPQAVARLALTNSALHVAVQNWVPAALREQQLLLSRMQAVRTAALFYNLCRDQSSDIPHLDEFGPEDDDGVNIIAHPGFVGRDEPFERPLYLSRGSPERIRVDVSLYYERMMDELDAEGTVDQLLANRTIDQLQPIFTIVEHDSANELFSFRVPLPERELRVFLVDQTKHWDVEDGFAPQGMALLVFRSFCQEFEAALAQRGWYFWLNA